MKTLITATAFLLIAGSAIAQQPTDTVQLDPLVVTATRVPIALSKVTASVSVIDGEQLRKAGIRTVEEALRTITGAAVVQSGSYGANTALFLRGGESDYVQVLVDGVQINSPGEAFNWSTLSVEDVDRIEVVKGPASVLYGSDAVAGVVQIITRRGHGKPRGNLAFMLGRGDKVGDQANGSFDNGYLRAELAGGTPSVGYSIGVSHFSTDGAYAFNNAHRNTSVTAHSNAQLGSATSLSGSVRYDNSRFHYPTDGTGALTDRNQFNDGALVAVGVDATHRFSPAVEGVLSLEHNNNQDITDDRADNAADTVGFYRYYSEQRFRRENADLRFNVRAGNASVFTLGTEFEKQKNIGSSTSPYGDSPEATESRDNRAAYGQLLTEAGPLSVQLGVRGEDNEKFGRVATYRGGIAARLTSALRLHASAGTAFKQPRFYEQFAEGFVKGNPNLKPERSQTVDVGVDATMRMVRFGATYFHQNFKDLIQYLGAPAKSDDPNYVNVAGARASGLELSADVPVDTWQVNARYTLLSTKVTNDGDGSDASFARGEELVRRPGGSGSLTVVKSLARTNLSATATYVGKRSDLDFADYPAKRVTLSAYTRVDVAAQQHINNTLAVTLKIENALNRKYAEVLGFPARERVLFLGADVAF